MPEPPEPVPESEPPCAAAARIGNAVDLPAYPSSSASTEHNRVVTCPVAATSIVGGNA